MSPHQAELKSPNSMAKKKAESKADSDLKEIQEWNKKLRERIQKAKEASKDASGKHQKIRDDD